MHLQRDSLPLLLLAWHFTTFWLGCVQKWKFWDCRTRRWPTSLGFSVYCEILFSLLLFLLSFLFLLQWLTFYGACLQLKKTSKKASSRRAIFTMDLPGVVAGNFALSFSLNVLSTFVHISGSTRSITLIWASLERSLPPAEVDYKCCQFWSWVMTSEVEERQRLVTAGYRRHRSQWVNKVHFLS